MYGKRRFLLTILIAVMIFLWLALVPDRGDAQQVPRRGVVGAAVTGDREAATRDFAFAGVNWRIIANNGFYIPKTKKLYNSYNQPSVSENGLVVFRARGKGHPRATGIFRRYVKGGGIESFIDLLTEVPYPNNLGTEFNEFPSIPRISPGTGLIATRGNHQPVYRYVLPDGSESRAGTTGIYVMTEPGFAVTATSKLGAVSDFEFFAVPETNPPVPFDVFPGSPSITDDGTLVFKGNYTVDGIPKTGAFFRTIFNTPAGGKHTAGILATTDMEIPNAPPSAGFKKMTFGSVSPPTAAGNKAVFVAVDNEWDPYFGGLYLVDLSDRPELVPLVEIGKPIPGLDNPPLTEIGEALAFDGRYVGFWGAWGRETKTLRLYCPDEGNADRVAYCKGGDPLSRIDKEVGRWYQEKEVPLDQGLFLFDTYTGQAYRVSDTSDFNDFLFWGYTGMVPGGGHEADDSDGEAPRWRSSAYLSVYGGLAAFKARTGQMGKRNEYFDPVDGIYLTGPLSSPKIAIVVETGMDGGILDPSMPAGLREIFPITEIGIEREGLRGRYLAISAKMGTEEDGWAGIYVGDVSGVFTTQRDPLTRNRFLKK